jgi:uncharacterized protein YbjT (DUF2867 family)
VRFFTTVTENLLEHEHGAGVGHHVTLSIAGVDEVRGNAHYAGKCAQEAAVEAGGVPCMIVPATQFHDFAAMTASWSERDGVAEIAPLLIQPVAPAEVVAVLADVATGAPQGRHVDIAGPDPHDLVDMARRACAARGRPVRLVPTWDGIFDSTIYFLPQDVRDVPGIFNKLDLTVYAPLSATLCVCIATSLRRAAHAAATKVG